MYGRNFLFIVILEYGKGHTVHKRSVTYYSRRRRRLDPMILIFIRVLRLIGHLCRVHAPHCVESAVDLKAFTLYTIKHIVYSV